MTQKKGRTWMQLLQNSTATTKRLALKHARLGRVEGGGCAPSLSAGGENFLRFTLFISPFLTTKIFLTPPLWNLQKIMTPLSGTFKKSWPPPSFPPAPPPVINNDRSLTAMLNADLCYVVFVITHQRSYQSGSVVISVVVVRYKPHLRLN